MNDSFVFKNNRPWPNPRLKRAAIVGHVSTTGAKVWFRTGKRGDFVVLVYPQDKDPNDALFAGFKDVPYKGLSALPDYVQKTPFQIQDFDSDSIYVADIENLSPLTEYCYALYGQDEDGNERILLGHDKKYGFRTMHDNKVPASFGIFSCHMPYDKTLFGRTEATNMGTWEFLQETLGRQYKKDLRFLIGCGDQVYSDGIDTLSIWEYLNKVMRKSDDTLLPEKESMISWYRDIYRGYWGFESIRNIFSSYPTYMIWDDHEMRDGWGSYILNEGEDDELQEIFPEYEKKGLERDDCLELLGRMEAAGKQVYNEYQHSHNPDMTHDGFDYYFSDSMSAFYVLDGRGNRDINRRSRRVLGQAQLQRFRDWANCLDIEANPYVFVVSAVPILHMMPCIVESSDSFWADWGHLDDDLRDAWEHPLHDSERKAVLNVLFGLAKKGARVCVIGGDVHISAVFRMAEPEEGATIYQLTSSAITYNKGRITSWLLGKTVPDSGQSEDNYWFERLALYTDTNFGLVRVDPKEDQVIFEVFGEQSVSNPKSEGRAEPVSHSIARIKLEFPQ